MILDPEQVPKNHRDSDRTPRRQGKFGVSKSKLTIRCVVITSYFVILNILEEAAWKAFLGEEDEETGMGKQGDDGWSRGWRWWEGMGQTYTGRGATRKRRQGKRGVGGDGGRL